MSMDISLFLMSSWSSEKEKYTRNLQFSDLGTCTEDKVTPVILGTVGGLFPFLISPDVQLQKL